MATNPLATCRAGRIFAWAPVFALLSLAPQRVAAQPGFGRGGFDPARMLERMDRNGDGRIERHEVPPFLQPRIDEVARRAGLNPNQPIDLKRLGEAMSGQRQDRDREREQEERSRRSSRSASRAFIAVT